MLNMQTIPMWFYPKIVDAQNTTQFQFPTSKVVCIGRNFVAHAQELNNPVPKEPLLFIKPNTCLVDFAEPLNLNHLAEPCHFETELAILIGSSLTNATLAQAEASICGVGLALDLTLREMQQRLKKQGHPWEKAKCFDNACPVTSFILTEKGLNWDQIEFKLQINGNAQQQGYTSQMIVGVVELIAEASKHFRLLPGDIVLTGTPAGVGQLNVGDQLALSLTFQSQDTNQQFNYHWQSVVNSNDKT
ncbi:fumarylacetoacetate hydrolase family protein [Aliikangiella sp. IMCC44632]